MEVVKNFFSNLFLSPHKVIKEFSKINHSLQEMATLFKESAPLEQIKLNRQFVFTFIVFPFLAGIAASIVYVAKESKNIKEAAKIVAVDTIERTKNELIYDKRHRSKITQKSVMILMRPPLFILAGYFLSFVGVFISSKHPLLVKYREIEEVMMSNRYLNSDGTKWDFAYVPGLIMLKTYNADVHAVFNNRRFWTAINFTPDEPITHEKDASIVMFRRAFDLPASISFDVLALINSNNK